MAFDEHPWPIFIYQQLERRYGIKIRWVELPALPGSSDEVFNLYERAITPKTHAIMVSHIMYTTGLLTPVKALSELTRRKGLLISVDGAHPVGMLDVNMKDIGCHHYAAAAQKWLLCGTGTGLCFLDEEIQDKIWSSVYVTARPGGVLCSLRERRPKIRLGWAAGTPPPALAWRRPSSFSKSSARRTSNDAFVR